MKSAYQQPSTFAALVDGLRNKSEAELKQLYLRFFSKELKKEWEEITQESDFSNTSEEDIIQIIQKNRYK